MFRQDKSTQVILLLSLLLYLGLSEKQYRYNGAVKISTMMGQNKYKLQLCSTDASICQVDGQKDTIYKLCDDQTDFFFNMCHAEDQQEKLSFLTSAMNCSTITPTESILTSAMNCPTITPTECTTKYTTVVSNTMTAGELLSDSVVKSSTTIYTVCTNTYTTTVSMAQTLHENRNTAKNLHFSQIALGAVVGILGVLLATVTTGWMCTCWAMKKRRREMNINTTNIRYSELQATNGNNTNQPLHNQAHDIKTNTMSLHHNQAYGTQPDKETNDSNTDKEYEVIPPLEHEKTTLNITEVNNDRENSNVQTSQNTTQPHQQASPEQLQEEVEHSHMQLEQPLTGSGEHKDSIGNNDACHTLEPKAEEEEDKAAPYEVPITTLMKPKNQ